MAKAATASSVEFIRRTSRRYAIYTCQRRGISCIPDGLIDSARKALWMIKDRALNQEVKVSALSGAMVDAGHYLHSDASGPISKLGAEFSNMPLLGKQGQLGTFLDPNSYGAPRYVYVKRTAVTDSLVYTDLDIVPLEENFDGSALIAKHFLPLIPLALLNGSEGIAMGWSSDVLPRNYEELIKATLQAIDGKPVDLLVPEYTALGARAKFLEFNSDGNSTWEFTGQLEMVDTSTVRVTALPPMYSIESFKEDLDGFVEPPVTGDKKKDEAAQRRWERLRYRVNDFEDQSTDSVNVTIRFKRGELKAATVEDLIDFFKLRRKTTELLHVLDFNIERILRYVYDPAKGPPTSQLIRDWVEWRFGWYKVRYDKKLADARDDLVYWLMFRAAFERGVPTRLLKLKDKAELVGLVMKAAQDEKVADPVPAHADKIASVPSYRWTQDGRAEVDRKIAEVEAQIADYRAILGDDKRRRGIFRDEVKALSKMAGRK